MDGYSNKDGVCPQLLDLIPKEKKWPLQRDGERRNGPSDESNELELRLGPPREEDWTIKNGSKNNSLERDQSLLSLGYFSNMRNRKDIWIMNNENNNGCQTKNLSSLENHPVVGTVFSSPWSSIGFQLKTQQQQQQRQQAKPSFLQLQSIPQSMPTAMAAKESPQQQQTCCTKVVDLQTAERKAFSPASANKAVPSSSQKRSAPAPVVGWPPIRSFRKNLASGSTLKQPLEPPNVVSSKVAAERPKESFQKGLFVKINMDGVPIGRKVDLKAYDSYDKLSYAVDELFRGLLAAQRDSSAGGIQNNQEGEKAITGLLDGSGEYTLVYEDSEGDRMLVGDVPWHMFVSTVKRLRVLKSSEVSTLCFGNKQEKLPLDAAKK